MIAEKYRLKNTIKYPTSLIIGGLSKLGLEIADSLIEQGGYVIIVDNYTEENVDRLSVFHDDSLVSFIDYTAIPHLDEDIRRLDYVFYFNHESLDFSKKVSTQQFLTFSNYLDATLTLSKKFDAKFLLTTAIRANQLILSSHELNLGYVDTIEKHTVYTEMEVQKYAESLVMEYHEKTKLDTRIIRLGEIIGDGMDFSTETTFIELIMSAAKGEPLKLKKDGLETEWYIHILDAAYGIIKAQFSRNTTGQIYSLAYENPLTNLAVAYKIQEIDSESGDIQFVNERDNLPSIKLYKPAPNLSQIGWVPKIPFDKAVRQSVASAKIYLLENHQEKSNKGTIVDKIKGFLAIADSDESISSNPQDGPVSRLIAERKRQEELRTKKIEYAADSIRIRKKKQNRTVKDEFQNSLWNMYLWLGNTFNVLKNRPPAELGLMILGLIVIILLYAFVISPAAVVGRDFLIISPEYQKAKANFATNNFTELDKNASTIGFYVKDIDNVISKYQGLSSILALGNQYNEIENSLHAYELYFEGMENISYAISPLNDYLSRYQNNTQLRSATDSYLSITGDSLDYSSILKEQNNRLPYLDSGIAKVNKASNQIDAINYNLIPPFLATEFAKVNQYIKSNSSFTGYIDSLHYVNEILGVGAPKTYVFLVLDNTRQTPAGGEIAAFAMLTLKNGGVTEVVVQSPDEVNFKFNKLTSSILKDINSRNLTPKGLGSLTINDIANISDYRTFANIISLVFGSTYNRTISGVGTIDYIGLNNLLKNLNSKGLGTSINSVKFDGGDFLQELKLTQVGNESLETKHAITAQVLASVLNNSFNNIKATLPSTLSILTDSASLRDFLFHGENLDYVSYLNSNDLNASKIADSDVFVIPGINTTDLKVVSLDKYPSVNVATELNVASDFSLSYKMNLKFPSVGTSEQVSVCLPLFVQDGSISVSGIPSERVIVNSGITQKCVTMLALTESSVTLNWKVARVGSSLSNNLYDLKLSLAKVRGANVVSDMKVTLDPSLTLVSITPTASITNNSAVFTQNLDSDQLIELNISK